MASVKILLKGPGETQWREWATLHDGTYEGEAQERAGKWVNTLQAGVEYEIVPA